VRNQRRRQNLTCAAAAFTFTSGVGTPSHLYNGGGRSGASRGASFPTRFAPREETGHVSLGMNRTCARIVSRGAPRPEKKETQIQKVQKLVHHEASGIAYHRDRSIACLAFGRAVQGPTNGSQWNMEATEWFCHVAKHPIDRRHNLFGSFHAEIINLCSDPFLAFSCCRPSFRRHQHVQNNQIGAVRCEYVKASSPLLQSPSCSSQFRAASWDAKYAGLIAN